METMFVTITGTNHYYGLKPFKVGSILKLVKDNLASKQHFVLNHRVLFLTFYISMVSIAVISTFAYSFAVFSNISSVTPKTQNNIIIKLTAVEK